MGLISADSNSKKDIKGRIEHTSQAFGKINRMWRNREITKKSKIRMYEVMTQSIFLYGSEF